MTNHPLLQVQGLKKHFPVRAGLFRRQVATNYAVDGVDFTIEPGQIVGIVGESGSGKSTLARAVIRLLEPTSGSVKFNGQDLLALSKSDLKKIRPQIQMVFQDPFASLNPRKSVGENIGEALKVHGIVRNAKEQTERVAETLLQIGLETDSMNRYPHQFSGGQQQRICIGRAIALRPRMLVCDEAVSALDVSVRSQILNLLSQLKDQMGLSYLFISHDMSVIRHFCDKVVVMYLGKVMEAASTEALFTNPKHPYTQALLSAIPKPHPESIAKRLVLSGEIPSSINPPSGCPFRTRCPYAQPICAVKVPEYRVLDPATGKKDHLYNCISVKTGFHRGLFHQSRVRD